MKEVTMKILTKNELLSISGGNSNKEFAVIHDGLLNKTLYIPPHSEEYNISVVFKLTESLVSQDIK
jgi:hypothetical protein